MEWINVEDKHFVDIEYFYDGSYECIENKNCPKEPFLVGLFTRKNNNHEFATFNYWLVVLGENGLEEWTEDCTYPLDCWDILDIEYWCTIVSPKND